MSPVIRLPKNRDDALLINAFHEGAVIVLAVSDQWGCITIRMFLNFWEKTRSVSTSIVEVN
jgi:hypothetical protein